MLLLFDQYAKEYPIEIEESQVSDLISNLVGGPVSNTELFPVSNTMDKSKANLFVVIEGVGESKNHEKKKPQMHFDTFEELIRNE